MYRFVIGNNDPTCNFAFILSWHLLMIREAVYKLLPIYCKYEFEKHYFTNTVAPIWNSLPNSVVTADSISSFKNRLDKFWPLHDFVYDYRAQPLTS